MDFSKHLAGMGLNENAPKYGDSEKKPVAMVFSGRDFTKERDKVRQALIDSGVPTEEVDSLIEKAEAKTKEMLGEIEKRLDENKTPRFGAYSIGALMGFRDGDAWDKAVDELTAAYRSNPDATVPVKLGSIMEAANFLKGSERKALELGEQGFASATEMGSASLIAFAMAGIGKDVPSPKKVMARLVKIQAGEDPEDLEFQPLFDKEFAKIMPIWKKYKAGQISSREWAQAVVEEIGEDAMKCQCEDCRKLVKK